MSDRAVFGDSFLTVYCCNEYLTQKMCDKVVDDSVALLKLILDWCFTNKMTKNFLLICVQTKIYSILSDFLGDFDNVVFNCNGRVFLILILIVLILLTI